MGRIMSVAIPLLVLAVVSLCYGIADAAAPPQPKLQWHYYKMHNTCREVEEYVRHEVKLFWDHDKSITAKLLRLVYSDCFVTGCDASVLLDEGSNPEKKAPQNRGLGGFVVIDKIKVVLESRCPGIVSCADILHLATRDAVHLAGAPSYPVFTGRKDGMKSDAASVDLPSPSISWQEALAYFESRGLDVLDMTTLLGAHSMGQTHCSYIVDRLYNYNGTGKSDPSMNATFLDTMKKLCPPRKKGQTDPLVYLNPESGSSYNFTESYYKRILNHEAVLEVDQQLLNGDDTKQITEEFAAGFEDFRKSFALSMFKMGNIKVLTGNQGEIRRNCRYTNKGSPN
ncbi:probable peroxidase 26 [Gastrolobium bilobum]|uniref:probable peroxidase 26 n=1 Tax=Gastrolobium bilobum TaxID=150636 RepID=UPI002AAF1D62|nr:probable peroxidase 26 [Gastrolobium bilobum]